MNTKIREHLNWLFQDAPKTKKAVELKEEMIADAQEKLNDLIAEGYQEEDALAIVIHSIGNVEDLFKELADNEIIGFGRTEYEMMMLQRKARITAISVGMYILAFIVFFAFAMFDGLIPGVFNFTALGLTLGIVIAIFPTMLLVYIFMATPKYSKKENGMVGGHKERKLDATQAKETRRAVSGVIWSITIVIYFLVSFTFSIWHISWILFLVAFCVESVVRLIMKDR